ncbi:type II toxin-antitoxin system RelE/ParE family toxin [Pleurocapsales cyanobacterium LEGE 06147]|nr:type II toxin-antitoxin system RelE/ParE family toxin [Pleurocapsales cyanobacterium LEGE 06147]
MAVKFRKQAIKFLEKSNPQEIENIRSSIQLITLAVEEQGIIPFTELDIKKMKGDWKGYYRLRIGKNRVIFTIDFNSKDIIIYAIGARGDIYK